VRSLILAVLVFLLAGSSATNARPFDLRRDTFAFSNDTVFAYGVDEAGSLHIRRRSDDNKPSQFTHRCFVLARGVLQFHQFARFAPEQPRLSREEYERRLKRLFRTPVWSRGPRERIVFPGYADLHSFSKAYQGLLKETLGNWFPTYIRVGNYRMAMGHPRSGQEMVSRWLLESVKEGRPRAIYLSLFPKMNHVVIVYAAQQRANGDVRFIVYDPNYPGEPSWVEYKAAERSFDFQKRWYFPGGRVNVMRIYLSPFH
jgi:hypothetical protein